MRGDNMMRPKTLGLALLVAVALALTLPLVALAHTKITVGPYTLEVGWVDEPPLVGNKNGVSISVVTTSDDKPVEDVSALVVTVSTGGRDKQLELHPAGEDTPGLYTGDFIPTVRGTYTVKLSGKIGDTDVSTSVDIEEVANASDLQFPETLPDAAALQQSADQAQSAAASAASTATIGVVLGVLGILIGGFALVRGRR
jgi:hypothetical protein